MLLKARRGDASALSESVQTTLQRHQDLQARGDEVLLLFATDAAAVAA